MKSNVPREYVAKTAEGGAAFAHMTPMQALRRSVLSCLLWEKEAYESGQLIADRIMELAKLVKPDELAKLAVEARSEFHLRHVPLLLLCALVRYARGNKLVAPTIAITIQRADEIAEFVSLYWKLNPKRGTDARSRPINAPLSKQMKIGLGLALRKFNAYDFGKYNRDAEVKLRDVLFLVHGKPADGVHGFTKEARAKKVPTPPGGELYQAIVDGTLPIPDTWETELSAGKDKKATFERLIREKKLGYLALLRNLRGMLEAGVDQDLIKATIEARRGADRVLPFRYIAAARAAPKLEPSIDKALLATIEAMPKLKGTTVVLVDVSGSMNSPLSAKSDLTRRDAACALAAMIHSDSVDMYSFSDRVVQVPPRRGMAGVDALIKSQRHIGTYLFDAVDAINKKVKYDRIIVITDEQATGAMRSGYLSSSVVNPLPNPVAGTKGYMINVASAKNGVGYGVWCHLDGFSEAVLRFIYETENQQ